MSINTIFDKIYCIHCAEENDRLLEIKKEFEKIGLSDDVDIWWDCKKEINTRIGNSINEMHTVYYDNLFKDNKNVYGSVYATTNNHYTIIKQSYIRGFNNILITEDDIKFANNLDLIHDSFINVPNDFSILKYESICLTDLEEKQTKQEFFKTNDHKYLPGAACYCLNRRGMKKYIDYVETKYVPADIPFYQFIFDNELYVIKYPIVKQDRETFKSTIDNNTL